MKPSLRRFMLVTHVACSVGLPGAVAGFLALAIAGLVCQDTQTVRAAYIAMDLMARFTIVPLAIASLLTGLVQSLGTTWGLFRHYWVLMKFVLTVFVTAVLLSKMQLIGYVANRAAETILSATDLRVERTELLVHAAAGLLVLFLPVVLSLYKPRGMTRYGWRKQTNAVD